MKIAVLGTGMVGQSLAPILAKKGHNVIIGTRDVQKTMNNMEPHPFGMPSFGQWYKNHSDIPVATFKEAIATSDLLINATNGFSIIEILKNVPAGSFENKVLLDVANALDFSKGIPPRVSVTDTLGASIGESIQAAFPKLRVVKSMNTLTSYAMLNPAAVQGGESTLFMSGNDAAAKATILELLQSFGWKDVIDLGDISNAGATELMMPIWLRVWGKLGQTTVFNFKIVR